LPHNSHGPSNFPPSRSTLIRWGGLAALAAGALYFLGAILAILDRPAAYLFTLKHLPSVWGVPIGLLMVGGLAGLHARQAGNPGYGLLGMVGFMLASVGDLLLAALGPLVSSAVPGGAFPFMVGMVVILVAVLAAGWGMILLGVATLRAALLPLPWRALPLAFFLLDVPLTTLAGTLYSTVGVSALLYAQPLLLGLGWTLLGYALWSGMGEDTQRRGTNAL